MGDYEIATTEDNIQPPLRLAANRVAFISAAHRDLHIPTES